LRAGAHVDVTRHAARLQTGAGANRGVRQRDALHRREHRRAAPDRGQLPGGPDLPGGNVLPAAAVKRVEFLFDYASPWSYLASELLPRRLPGIAIEYRPIYLRG